MPPYAERKKKFIEKLKADGKFDEYKKKRAKMEKARRIRVKEALSKLSVAKQNEAMLENRIKNRKGVQHFRMRQKAKKMSNEEAELKNKNIPEPHSSPSTPTNTNDQRHSSPTPTSRTPLTTSSSEKCSCRQKRIEPIVSKSINFQHSYNTSSALSKAGTKCKKSLPKSPSKRKAVAALVLRSFSESDQNDIIGYEKTIKSTAHNALAHDLVKDIRLFYERDDVSRISPNVKDARKFVNPDTGQKEVKQVRHLMFKLSEVYEKFIAESRDQSTHPPVKLSKFCELRPEHVFLMANTPREVCFCLYHSNFIQCATALHKNIPELPSYGPNLIELLVCSTPTRECYFKTCSKCDTGKIDQKIRQIAKQTSSKSKNVQWLQWVKDESANRFQNRMEKGSRKKLVDYFLSIYSKFLKHSYIKREQEKAFDADRKRVESGQHADEAVLQIDFAENFKCECQDEVQQAHYNQKQISLFTTALHHAGSTHAKVIASDNTHHTKETVVAYLYSIFKDLPSTVKTVKVWSDGPSSQFKNKFIAAIIPLFESKFHKKIVWNYFATAHGKSCIDGIGAAVKSKVKGLILSRQAIVNNTKQFVSAFLSKKSTVDLTELTDTDINKINVHLKLDEVFARASNIQDISKFHRLEFLNNKTRGFVTTSDGYLKKC